MESNITTRCVLVCAPGQIGSQRHMDYYDSIQFIGRMDGYDIIKVTQFTRFLSEDGISSTTVSFLLERGKYEIQRTNKSLVLYL